MYLIDLHAIPLLITTCSAEEMKKILIFMNKDVTFACNRKSYSADQLAWFSQVKYSFSRSYNE